MRLLALAVVIWLSSCARSNRREPEDEDVGGTADAGPDVDSGGGEEQACERTLGDEENTFVCESIASRLACDELGDLTLNDGAEASFVWISDQGSPGEYEPVVRRIETRTLQEEGRYWPGPETEGPFVGGLGVNLEVSAAVGLYLATRAGRVTRIDARDCPPGDTSAGEGDLLDWGEDACVAWSTELDNRAEGIAWELRDVLDGREYYLWVTDRENGQVVELTGEGERTDRAVSVAPSVLGRSIAFDGDMDLWVSVRDTYGGNVTEVDTVAAAVIRSMPLPRASDQCMAVDPQGRVWTTGSSGDNYVVDADEEEVFVSGFFGAVGVAADAGETVWLGGTDGRVYRVDASDGIDDLEIDSFDAGLLPEEESHHAIVAVDVDGRIWAMSLDIGFATVFPANDPEAHQIGATSLEVPGTCGDLTGSQLASKVVDARTEYSWIVEPCPESDGVTRWVNLAYDAQTPGSSSIVFEARAAAAREALEARALVEICAAPGSPSPCDLAASLSAAGQNEGAVLQLRIRLQAGTSGEKPTLREVRVQSEAAPSP